MSARREFSRSIKVEIIKRATRDGVVYCEECGSPTRRFDIDHIDADGLQVDKSKPLTSAHGKLLCSGKRETCHGRKTAEKDIPAIAKAKRSEAAHLGAKAPNTVKIPQLPKVEKSTSKLDQIRALPRRWESDETFISIGDAASNVLAKLNPKKAAE